MGSQAWLCDDRLGLVVLATYLCGLTGWIPHPGRDAGQGDHWILRLGRTISIALQLSVAFVCTLQLVRVTDYVSW